MTNFGGVERRFLDLHVAGSPLLMPNPWDAGSARLLVSLGFKALATTSSGHAATLGRLDGGVSREEALAHGALIAAATASPVSADLENCFADDPAGAAETVRLATETGLAGCSIEDATQRPDEPLYDFSLAVERVAAAAEAAHGAPTPVVLTARAERAVRDADALADTIARLQAFEAAGADVLFAPRVFSIEDIRTLVREVRAPVNVLMRGGGPTVAELADAGVARISVGGALAYVAMAAVAEAATALRDEGTYSFGDSVAAGHQAAVAAFSKE